MSKTAGAVPLARGSGHLQHSRQAHAGWAVEAGRAGQGVRGKLNAARADALLLRGPRICTLLWHLLGPATQRKPAALYCWLAADTLPLTAVCAAPG